MNFQLKWMIQVFPEPLIEETVFLPLYSLASFVKYRLPTGAWVYLWAFPYSKVLGFDSNTQKSIAFLYTNTKKSGREVPETIPFTVATKRLKYLGGVGKESTWNTGDLGLILGLRRSPGEGNGYRLQYSCLENSMDREASGLQSMGSQRVRHNWATNTFT